MNVIPNTVDRVPNHCSSKVNQRIRHQTEENLAHFGNASDAAIEQRLKELDEEWDIERSLEADAATISLIGLGLGAFVNRRFYALPAVVSGFLLQHALQGWCPPMPVMRRLGFRTQPEIEQERYALKAMRGDFDQLSQADSTTGNGRAATSLAATRR